jgi:hypothetical protein
MPVTQVPGKAHQLTWILMPDFNSELRSSLNLQPLPIFEQQAISVGHRDRSREVEKDRFTLIRNQANAAAMARVKIEGDSARSRVNRPKPGGAMNRNAVVRHIST